MNVLSGLDFVRVEVKVQEVLQGLRVARSRENTSTCVYLGLGGSARARRFDVHTTAEVRGETDLVYNQNRVRAESSPDRRE
jgi:hypothetical protein